MESGPTPHIPRPNNPEARPEHILPIDAHRDAIIESIRHNPEVLIVGETGSGKTTRTPLFLLDAFPDARIAITEPRRVAARSVAQYVAKQIGTHVGGTIGCQVRFEDVTSDETRASFMTDGVLLRKLQNDRLLQDYDIVMVDEAHERSLNIDFLIGLLKECQHARNAAGLPELKIVIASATLEKEKFATYFNDAPLIEAPGRLHPIEIHYESVTPVDYCEAAAQKVQLIMQRPEQGDILIFMPGDFEIKRTIEKITELGLDDVEILPLSGSVAPEDQNKIFKQTGRRKIVVATNIAETSITLEGLKFVIDSGAIKQKEFNPNTGIESLVTKPHAQSGCKQRSGRAGRTAPGICYRLYSESDFNRRRPFQTPEIMRSSLDHVILTMKKMRISNVEQFPFIDPPKVEALEHGIDLLQTLGALDEQENLTPRGEVMADIPLRPEYSRMIIEAHKHKCVDSVAIIVAMLGEKSIFARPQGLEDEADMAHQALKPYDSDFLNMLHIWKCWQNTSFNQAWSRKNFLNGRQLMEAREVYYQLISILAQNNIPNQEYNRNDDTIGKCIAAGLLHHMSIKNVGMGASYTKLKDAYADPVFIHPGSSCFAMQPSLAILYPVVRTTKSFARNTQPLKPEWLMEIAPELLERHDPVLEYDGYRNMYVRRREIKLKGTERFLGYEVKEAPNSDLAPLYEKTDVIMQSVKDIRGKINTLIQETQGSLSEAYTSLSVEIDTYLRSTKKYFTPDGHMILIDAPIIEDRIQIWQFKIEQLKVRQDIPPIKRHGPSSFTYNPPEHMLYRPNQDEIGRQELRAALARATPTVTPRPVRRETTSMASAFEATSQPAQPEEKSPKNKTPREEKPAAPEIVTEELRTSLLAEIEIGNTILTALRDIPEPTIETKTTTIISKARAKAKELRTLYRDIAEDIPKNTSADSLRGKVGDLMRRIHKIAADIAEAKEYNIEWSNRLQNILRQVPETLKSLEIILDESARKKVGANALIFAQSDKEMENVSAVAEQIIIDSL